MKIDENAAMIAVERACPGLKYVLILHSDETKETVMVGNIPPPVQKAVLQYILQEMENTTPMQVPAPKITND